MIALREVCDRVGKSPRTVMRWVDAHKFPRPIVRNAREVLWREEPIESYLRRRRNKGRKT